MSDEKVLVGDLKGSYIFEGRYGRVGLVKKVDRLQKTITVEFQEPVVAGRLKSAKKIGPFIKLTQEIPLGDAYLLERLPKDMLGMNLEEGTARSEIVTPVFRFNDGGFMVSKTQVGKTDPRLLNLSLLSESSLAMEKPQRSLKPGQLLLIHPNSERTRFTLGLFDSAYAATGVTSRALHPTDKIAFYPLKPSRNSDSAPDVVTLLNAGEKERMESFDTGRLRVVPSLSATVVTPIENGTEVQMIKRGTLGGTITEGTVVGKAPALNGKGNVFLVEVNAERSPIPPKFRGGPWSSKRTEFNDGRTLVATGNLRHTGCFFGRLSMIQGME